MSGVRKVKTELDDKQKTGQRLDTSIPPEALLETLTNIVQITPGTLKRLRGWLLSEDARYITKLVLVLIAAGAFSAAAIIAPGGAAGLAQLLKPLITNRRRRSRVVQRLTKDRLFSARVDRNGRVVINLTKRGQAVALKAHAEALSLVKPKVWDKQWRLVLFDVPEKDRAGRDVLRRKLRDLGFLQIQKSAWLLPWPCEAELRLFRERFGLEDTILIYTIADNKEFEQARIKFFGK